MSNQNNQITLEEIARQLGTTVEKLLESGKKPEQIVEEYKQGNLRLLNE